MAGVSVFLLALVTVAGWYFYSAGYLLYYGDAQAHLNGSRSWIDSRTPGYDQVGTVWLPILHLICLPFVSNDFLWTTGLAGTIPVAACFVIAGVCLYFSGKEANGGSFAAAMGMLCFALNPNVLYLATITMTEIVFVAGLAFCLLAVLRFRATQNWRWIAAAISASWWMSLTRYDGWFLIPFSALFLAYVSKTNRLRTFVMTGALSALAPVYWVAHNWWQTSNPLDFYNGPYSAAAIQRYRPYPGFHDWPKALHYYFEAGRLCCGDALLAVGVAGCLAAIWKRRVLSLALLSITPLFYIWSIHSSWTPIHVPDLWPFSYYNTRYGLAIEVLSGFAAGSLVSAIPVRFRGFGLLVPVIAVIPWVPGFNPDQWICWKESEQNSIARRTWTAQAAAYLDDTYKRGDGVLTEFGDLAGVFCKSRIPLNEALHEGNGPLWFGNIMPSGMVRQMKWAMAQEGDSLSKVIDRARSYQVAKVIRVKGAPMLLIYERRYEGATP